MDDTEHRVYSLMHFEVMLDKCMGSSHAKLFQEKCGVVLVESL